MLEWFNEQIVNKEMPFFSRFTREILGVCEDTALEYVKKYPRFSEAYKKAKDMQKEFLINQTLKGDFNPTFAIFTACNITDMKNVNRFEHSGRTEHTEKLEITVNHIDLKDRIEFIQNMRDVTGNERFIKKRVN